jgi:hypothetical protein
MANFAMEISCEQRRRTGDRNQPCRRYQIPDQAFHFISPSAYTNTPLSMVFFAEDDIYTVLLEIQSRFLRNQRRPESPPP